MIAVRVGEHGEDTAGDGGIHVPGLRGFQVLHIPALQLSLPLGLGFQNGLLLGRGGVGAAGVLALGDGVARGLQGAADLAPATDDGVTEYFDTPALVGARAGLLE